MSVYPEYGSPTLILPPKTHNKKILPRLDCEGLDDIPFETVILPQTNFVSLEIVFDEEDLLELEDEIKYNLLSIGNKSCSLLEVPIIEFHDISNLEQNQSIELALLEYETFEMHEYIDCQLSLLKSKKIQAYLDIPIDFQYLVNDDLPLKQNSDKMLNIDMFNDTPPNISQNRSKIIPKIIETKNKESNTTKENTLSSLSQKDELILVKPKITFYNSVEDVKNDDQKSATTSETVNQYDDIKILLSKGISSKEVTVKRKNVNKEAPQESKLTQKRIDEFTDQNEDQSQSKSSLFPESQGKERCFDIQESPQEKIPDIIQHEPKISDLTAPCIVCDKSFEHDELFLDIFKDCRIIFRSLQDHQIELSPKECVLFRDISVKTVSNSLSVFDKIYVFAVGNCKDAMSYATVPRLFLRQVQNERDAFMIIRSMAKPLEITNEGETLFEYCLSLFPCVPRTVALDWLQKGNPISDPNCISKFDVCSYMFQIVLDSKIYLQSGEKAKNPSVKRIEANVAKKMRRKKAII